MIIFGGASVVEPYLHMRYDGTDCALMCAPTRPQEGEAPTKHGDFLRSFVERYKSEFGFVISERRVVVDDIRVSGFPAFLSQIYIHICPKVRGVGKSIPDQASPIETSSNAPNPNSIANVFFGKSYSETNVYQLRDLKTGQEVKGPAIIMDELCTILVEPECTAVITQYGDIKITVGSGKLREIGPELDSIQLSIFSHRFMSIAEQMGR